MIWGSAGEFQIKETWDSVTITNYSDRKLVTNDINVVSSGGALIEVSVNTIPGPPSAPANGVPISPLYAAGVPNASTFEFDIHHLFPKTLVEVTNLHPVGGTAGGSDIVLDGSIENPIGRTEIQNVRGNVYADSGTYTPGCSPGATCGLGIESTGVDANHVAIFAYRRRRTWTSS